LRVKLANADDCEDAPQLTSQAEEWLSGAQVISLT